LKNRKYIVEEGNLKIGYVEYHYQLAKGKNVSGGGMWDYDEDKNVIRFFGDSYEFGAVSLEEFKDAFERFDKSLFMLCGIPSNVTIGGFFIFVDGIAIDLLN